MKSVITTLLFAAIGVLIILIVSIVLMSSAQKAYEEKSLEALKMFKTYRPYIFDISDLLVDPSDPNVWSSAEQTQYYNSGNDPQFCKDIRKCIENNFKEGQSHCLLSYKVRPDVSFDPDVVNSAISNCPPEDVKEEIDGIGRKVCSFDGSSIQRYNKFKENNISLIDYEPYLHNCYIPPELGTRNILPDKTDQINYLYSGRGTETGYRFENGGTVRIVVTNFSVKDYPVGTCSYSLYICGQNAIAASEDETPVEIFKTIQTLGEKGLEKGENELYFNKTIYWGGPTPKMPGDLEIETIGAFFSPVLWSIYYLFDWANRPKPPPINNLYGYYPRTHEFIFSGTYPNKEALIDAVDAGMWEWSEKHYTNKESMKYFMDIEPAFKNIYFSYSPIDNILEDPSKINFDQGCWNSNYESSNAYDRLKIDADSFEDSDNLKHNFNFSSFDFNVGDTIRMNLGIKKLFITLKEWKIKVRFLGFEVYSRTFSLIKSINNEYGIDLDPRVILVMDPVTICPRPATCGNGACDWMVGECDSCPSECSLADCCAAIAGNDPDCNSAVGENSGNCADCPPITCPDDSCDPGENCPDDASACTDNICYEPTCTNGCGEYAVPAGGQDEACHDTTGCGDINCKCDGLGNCTSGGVGATSTEELWVNANTTDRGRWTWVIGNEPYLDNSDDSYILTPTTDDEMGYFLFEDHVGNEPIVSVNLSVEIYWQRNWTAIIWDDSDNQWVDLNWLAESGTTGGSEWVWVEKDITNYINSWDEVNNFRVYFKKGVSSPSGYWAYIRKAKLVVEYSAISPAVCGDGVREGIEECDPPAASSAQCGGFQCENDCTCLTCAEAGGRCRDEMVCIPIRGNDIGIYDCTGFDTCCVITATSCSDAKGSCLEPGICNSIGGEGLGNMDCPAGETCCFVLNECVNDMEGWCETPAVCGGNCYRLNLDCPGGDCCCHS